MTDSAEQPAAPDESPKRLIVVGDRVLIMPEEGEERTNVGLYLPQTALDSRQVQGGRIVATGPGTPMTEDFRARSLIVNEQDRGRHIMNSPCGSLPQAYA